MTDRSHMSLRFSDYRWLPVVDVVSTRDFQRDPKGKGLVPLRIKRFHGLTRQHAFRRALQYRQEHEA